MSNIALAKTSNPSDIERYFRGILELDKQNKEFSVNLDDVWQLAYERKDNAVRGLKTNFIENVDFIVIRNNAENSGVGRPTDDYYLTSACLEYFVARKVRPVFEVYRRVFHRAIAQVQQTSLQEQVQANLTFADWTIKTLNLNEASKICWAKKIAEKFDIPTDALPSGVNAGTEAPTLHAAKDLLKENNIPLTSVAFNRILMKKGVIHEATRPSRDKNKPWKWKVLNKGFEGFGPDCSLCLNLFSDMKALLPEDIDLSMWKVKDMEWVKDCPVPEGEDFRRIKELF